MDDAYLLCQLWRFAACAHIVLVLQSRAREMLWPLWSFTLNTLVSLDPTPGFFASGLFPTASPFALFWYGIAQQRASLHQLLCC
jgi:hypothetical protein